MPAASLPDRPHLDQLRRQAKELRDAARAGDPTARERIRTHTGDAGAASLATAQLTIAREHGFASWPQLKTEIEHRIVGRAQRVRELLEASVREPMQADAGLRNERAARLLATDPGIARHDIRTAAVLGEAGRMRELLAEDPGLAVHPDPESGLPALLFVCLSRWHRIDPDRAAGMLETTRLLLAAGAAWVAGKPPSSEVAELLRRHGVGPDQRAA